MLKTWEKSKKDSVKQLQSRIAVTSKNVSNW
jgi:hypothetical protein